MRRAGAVVGESTEETRLGCALEAAGFTNKQLSENTVQGEEKGRCAYRTEKWKSHTVFLALLK